LLSTHMEGVAIETHRFSFPFPPGHTSGLQSRCQHCRRLRVGISHARPECPEPWTRCSERAKCLFGRAGERHHVSRASPGRVCWRSRRRSGPSTRTRARALTFNPGHTFNPGDRMIDRAPDVALQISRSRIHSHRPSPSTAAPLPYSPAALHPPAISLAQCPRWPLIRDLVNCM